MNFHYLGWARDDDGVEYRDLEEQDEATNR